MIPIPPEDLTESDVLKHLITVLDGMEAVRPGLAYASVRAWLEAGCAEGPMQPGGELMSDQAFEGVQKAELEDPTSFHPMSHSWG